MSVFDELIARLEKATGPDRELDARIWLVVGDELGDEFSLRGKKPIRPREIVCGRWMGSALEKYPDYIKGVCASWRVPLLTACIDAALTLVPEGWFWRVGRTSAYKAWAGVNATHPDHGEPGRNEFFWHRKLWEPDSTPAIALCIAALKARAASPKPSAEGEG